MSDEKQPAKGRNRNRQPSGPGTPAVRQLRAVAEERLAQTPGVSQDLTGKTAEKILHELRVHQIELEMQNEKLKRAQVALEESRDKYLDLYDFAPAGYFTLTPGGRIMEVNLSGAAMLGLGRPKLVRRSLGRFVAPHDLDRWERHLLSMLHSSDEQICELTLKREDGSTFDAHLASIRLDRLGQEAGDGDTGPLIRVAMSDISELKQAERALRETLNELDRRIEERTADLSRTVWTLQEEVTERTLAEQTLGKRSEQLQAMSRLPDENPNPVLRVDARGTILYANGAAEEKLLEPWGVPPAGGLSASLCGEVAAVLSNGRPTEMQITAADRTYLLMLAPIADMGYVNLYGRDITDRKAAEERYGTILKTTMDGFSVVDAQGRIIEANDAFCQMTGYSQQELLGMSILDLDTSESPDGTADHIRRIVAAGRDRFEARMHRKDGRSIDVEISVTYMEEPSKLLFSFARDITERKRAEEEVRRRNALLTTQQEVSIDGILTVDEGGTILSWNQRFAEIWGIPAELLRTRSDGRAFEYVQDMLVAPQDFLAKVKFLYEHPREASWDEIVLKDGRILDRYSASMWGPEDRYYGRVWYFRDVTEHRNLQKQFVQAQKMEAIGQLAGGIAHDFRNQLTVIKGYGEMLLRRSLVKEAGVEKVREILIAVDRSATIVGQLLAFSRQETLSPEVANVESLADDAIRSMAQALGEDIHLSMVPCRNLWNIRVDSGQFQQALLNLVMNARDAMAQGGQLTIETENIVLDRDLVRQHVGASPGRYVVLTISDTGVGMSPEILDHIFEPFFTTKRVGEGTGLGLPMVCGFVAQSGGFIEVQSQPGQGTRFRLYFPAVEDVAESVQPRSQSPDLPRGSDTVLVVEDEEGIRRFLLETLDECGYTVLTAGNAEEAMALIESARQEIDLLITDVVMPGRSGPELARLFQAARPGAAVLLMSGHTGKMLTGHGLVPPDVNLLVKPFSSETLAETVQKILGRPKRPQ